MSSSPGIITTCLDIGTRCLRQGTHKTLTCLVRAYIAAIQQDISTLTKGISQVRNKTGILGQVGLVNMTVANDELSFLPMGNKMDRFKIREVRQDRINICKRVFAQTHHQS